MCSERTSLSTEEKALLLKERAYCCRTKRDKVHGCRCFIDSRQTDELIKERKIRKEKEREIVRCLSHSNVHVVVLLIRLALQGRLLAGRLLYFQRRLSQSVLLHISCRLRRQNHVLDKRKSGNESEKVGPVERD